MYIYFIAKVHEDTTCEATWDNFRSQYYETVW